MMIGKDVEDYDIMIPYFTFEMVGYQVDTICHGKDYGEFVTTQISSMKDLTENGHQFRINQSFKEAIKKSSEEENSSYNGLVVSGGRDKDYLASHTEILCVVEEFLN
jgi:protease I